MSRFYYNQEDKQVDEGVPTVSKKNGSEKASHQGHCSNKSNHSSCTAHISKKIQKMLPKMIQNLACNVMTTTDIMFSHDQSWKTSKNSITNVM